MHELGTSHLSFKCDIQTGPLHLRAGFQLMHPWTALFGPSGSGKSTLLRAMAGLIGRQDTCLVLGGNDISARPAHRRRIALVGQQPALFPHLNVEDNIRFGKPPGREGQAGQLIELFNLQSLRKANPRNLSGGEIQRTALARALCSEPLLLLLDESFSGIHTGLRAEIVDVLRKIQAQRPPADPLNVLSVTHDTAEVFVTASEVLRMANGCIVAQGPPEKVLAEERQELLRALSAFD